MSSYKETKSYIWYTDESFKLGTGANAIVYRGIDKSNGEPVAVKTFIRNFDPREIRVLKKIYHKNIVKLLGIEETVNHDKVIIMELCSGGSLSKVLSEPENAYGLDDVQFLQVLHSLHDGIKYLNDNNLIHRDLKPDNIMKCIRDDGTVIYKLIDFGAARELEEGEQFQSIYGTEEYLHPDVYERVFLTARPKTFDGSIDLWSLGVTLYHVATGTLPFRPYGGRGNMNKSLLHKITTRKESGVISGIQTEQNGKIVYQKELPQCCLLSDHLKEIITPLLAGLMEADLNKTWNFNKFFAQVENILSRKIIYIFYVNQLSFISLYLPLEETYEALQDVISQKVGVDKLNQILFFENCTLNIQTISDMAITTVNNPLFLFEKYSNTSLVIKEKDLSFPRFPPQSSTQADSKFCKLLCKTGHQYKRDITKYSRFVELLYKAVEYFTNFLNIKFDNAVKLNKHLESKIITLKGMNKFMSSIHLNNELNAFIPEALEFITSLDCNCGLNTLKKSWEEVNGDINCSEINLFITKAATYVDLLEQSYKQFLQNYNKGILSQKEEKLHILEKIKVKNVLSKIQDLYDKIYSLHKNIAHNFVNWYQVAKTIHSELIKVQQKMDDYQEKIISFEAKFQLDGIYSKNNCKCLHNIFPNIMKKCSNRETCAKLLDEHVTLSKKLEMCFNEMEICLLHYKNLI